jgi:predicted DNA-binding WGR domain protein
MSLAQSLAQCDRIHLIARDDQQNIRRDYWIEQSPDLFGFTIVDWHWGRIGTAGQSRRAAFASKSAAATHVRQLLLRRDGAPKRIGVAYVSRS